MKSRNPRQSFTVPLAIGRSESDMTTRPDEYAEQLKLFRETLDRPGKVQLFAMIALSNPKALDEPTYARIADIAKAMGYEQFERKADGKMVFPPSLYQRIEEIGMRLRREPITLLVRKSAGKYKDGRTPEGERRKYRVTKVDLSVLQEFGFYYEREDGEQYDLDALPVDEKNDLIKYEDTRNGSPIWALPAFDDYGSLILNKDGMPRRFPASGLVWRWSSRFADLTRSKETSWRFSLDSLRILQRYQADKSVTFDLIWLTLFHARGATNIEFGYDSLTKHLGINTETNRNRSRIEAAIERAFDNMLKEGIIDTPPTIRESGYYKPTKKTGRERRKGKVYSWRVAKRWCTRQDDPDIIDIEAEDSEEEKAE